MPDRERAARHGRVAEHHDLAVPLLTAGRRHRNFGEEVPVAAHHFVRQLRLGNLTQRHRDTKRRGVVGVHARALGAERQVV